jgi:ferritin-like metal-binding protein YciE
MPNTSKDDLISWLNDAYSMELSVAEVLENHVKDAEKQPAIQSRLQQHLGETKRHAEMVKGCIESAGGQVSTSKAWLGDIMGRLKGISTGMYQDELVKNVLSEYATEHFEIASYESIISGAETIGQTQVAQVCRQILEDEKQMAQWVQSQIPIVTKNYMMQNSSQVRVS